jgi:ArsR family transcriptional regulator, arsenate/arsenite/antimonite-responsive transcriptional repressor
MCHQYIHPILTTINIGCMLHSMNKVHIATLDVVTTCCDVTPVQPRLHDAEAQRAADLMKALGDPARLQILDVLAQHGSEVCVCDLEGVVGLPDANGQRPKQPTISHHLRVLREAGLVGYEKRGQWAYYFVRGERVAEARALLDIFLR